MSERPNAADHIRAIEGNLYDVVHGPGFRATAQQPGGPGGSGGSGGSGGAGPEGAMGAGTTWEYWGGGTGWEVAPDGSYTGNSYGWD